MKAPGAALFCARDRICATVRKVQGRLHSLSDRCAFYLALIAFACVAMVPLSGSSPTPLAGTDWLTTQIHQRVEPIEAPDHSAAASKSCYVDLRLAEGLHQEEVEVLEPTEDDETERRLLRSDLVPRLDAPILRSETGLYESPADRAPTSFRLLAFSTRGSPSA